MSLYFLNIKAILLYTIYHTKPIYKMLNYFVDFCYFTLSIYTKIPQDTAMGHDSKNHTPLLNR